MSGQSGGIYNPGTIFTDGGHVVAGNYIQYGPSKEELLAAFAQSSRELLKEAQAVGLQSSTIIELARRLRPEVLDLDQAIKGVTP